MEIFGEILREVAIGGNIDTEVFERLHRGTEVPHFASGSLVRRVHQGIGGQPAAACGDGLDVGLGTEHEKESRTTTLLGVTNQRGRVHITGQNSSATPRVVGGDIAHRHQQAHRSVQDDTADIRLVNRIVLIPLFLAFLNLLGQIVTLIPLLFTFLGILALLIITLLVR